MRKSLNDRMDSASLQDLMGDFDKNVEWEKLSAVLHNDKKKSVRSWQIAASLLFLLGTLGVVSMLAIKNARDNQLAATGSGVRQNWAADVSPSMPAQHVYETHTAAAPAPQPPVSENIVAVVTNDNKPTKNNAPPRTGKNNRLVLNENNRTKEFVCNGTPCPLEICIIQTVHCKNQKPSAIATCNTLEPDQARQLHYKAPDAAGAHCKVTVDEIRIKRLTTGETIVLNAHSKPSTAEEFFNCMTGRQKCGLLAGIFEADCNNQQKTHSLKIDNNSGNLIMQ